MQRGQHPRAVNIQQISTSKQRGAALRTSLQMDVIDDPAHWVPQAWFETGATLITSSSLFNTMDGRPSEPAEVIDDAGSQVLAQQPMIAAGTILRCSSAEVDGARIEWAEYFPTSQHTISYSSFSLLLQGMAYRSMLQLCRPGHTKWRRSVPHAPTFP